MPNTFDLDPEKEITDITFDFEGAHMALCHKTQGFSANNKPMPMLIKSDDSFGLDEEAMAAIDLIKDGLEIKVEIETDMMTFLERWMSMSEEEATQAVLMMGIEVEEEVPLTSTSVPLLRSASMGIIPNQAFPSDIQKLQTVMDQFHTFKDSFSEGDPGMKKETTKASKPSEKTKTNQGQIMADKKTDQEKELDKAKAQAELEAKAKDQAELEAKAKAQDDFEARIATLEKAASDAEAENKVLAGKVDIFEKANQERLEKAFISKVTTYSFITEEEREEFAKTLLEVDNEAVIVALDKAQAAIVALGKPQGVDGGVLNLKAGAGSNRVKDMIMKEHGLTDVSK